MTQTENPTDAQLAAAIDRAIALGEYTVVDDAYLAQLKADIDADEARAAAEVDDHIANGGRVLTVTDHGGTFTITVTDTYGERLLSSIPTGRRAQHAEGRRRNLTEAVASVHARVEGMLASPAYRGALLRGVDALVDADPEALVR